MEPKPKEQLAIGSEPAAEPEIGRWLWALQDTRQRTLRALETVTPAMIDWQPPGDESTIGTVLYHIADIEADWLYVEVLQQPPPDEIAALLQMPAPDRPGRLPSAPGFSLEQHLDRLAAVRQRVLAAYQGMTLADFRRKRSLPSYDVTPEWVLHHLMQHEAEHRGQLGSLRDRVRLKSLLQKTPKARGNGRLGSPA